MKKEGAYSFNVRVTPELVDRIKEKLEPIKTKVRADSNVLFTMTNFLELMCEIPDEILAEYSEKVVIKKTAGKVKRPSLVKQISGASPEAKAKIEAILAQEAAKGHSDLSK